MPRSQKITECDNERVSFHEKADMSTPLPWAAAVAPALMHGVHRKLVDLMLYPQLGERRVMGDLVCEHAELPTLRSYRRCKQARGLLASVEGRRPQML